MSYGVETDGEDPDAATEKITRSFAVGAGRYDNEGDHYVMHNCNINKAAFYAGTMTAEDVYDHIEKTGDNVVVLGGGLVGTELAIHLARSGKNVTIMEMAPMLNSGGNILHQNALNTEIRDNNIKLALGTRACEITAEGVYGDNGEKVFFPADTVVCAMGQVPQTEAAYALRYCAPEFFVIGDCVTPKNIMQATAMANAAVNDL